MQRLGPPATAAMCLIPRSGSHAVWKQPCCSGDHFAISSCSTLAARELDLQSARVFGKRMAARRPRQGLKNLNAVRFRTMHAGPLRSHCSRSRTTLEHAARLQQLFEAAVCSLPSEKPCRGIVVAGSSRSMKDNARSRPRPNSFLCGTAM